MSTTYNGDNSHTIGLKSTSPNTSDSTPVSTPYSASANNSGKQLKYIDRLKQTFTDLTNNVTKLIFGGNHPKKTYKKKVSRIRSLNKHKKVYKSHTNKRKRGVTKKK